MTNRERYINCALCRPIDRTPFMPFFGPWYSTMLAWAAEGVEDPGNAFVRGFGFEPRVFLLNQYVDVSYLPAYDTGVIEERKDTVLSLNRLGQLVETPKHNETIPRIVESPVKTREDWEKLKAERLNPDDPARYPADWQPVVQAVKTADAAVQIGDFPWGVFGTLRDLLGVEESLIAFYDDPELVHTIMDDLTDFWLAVYEKAAQHVQIDVFHIWEDMSGKQGSLISPAMIREFMLPNYRKIRAFCDRHGIAVMQVDTDGLCEGLIPLFHEGGVNSMQPFEVAAGCDVVALREKYPYMSVQCGIDKRALAQGREAINRELERIRPLIGKTGFFPAPDHLIPPDVSYENYCYYVNRLKEMIFS